MDDHDAVAHAEHFRQFGRDHDDGNALGSQIIDYTIDFFLCTDVHASGRLVKNQYLRIGIDPLGNYDLLLITAGEIGAFMLRAETLDVEFINALFDQFSALLLGQHRLVGDLAEIGKLDVLCNALLQQQTLGLSVLGDEADAGIDGIPCTLDILPLS